MLTEFVELRSLRLDRGWTYRKLAEEINKVSPTTISLSSLHVLLNDPKQTPNELTLHGIRKFLMKVRAPRGRTGSSSSRSRTMASAVPRRRAGLVCEVLPTGSAPRAGRSTSAACRAPARR